MAKRITKPVPATTTETPADRHKQRGKLLRMNDKLWEQLDKLVEANASGHSEEIRTAVRERLERAGLWPPSLGNSNKGD